VSEFGEPLLEDKQNDTLVITMDVDQLLGVRPQRDMHMRPITGHTNNQNILHDVIASGRLPSRRPFHPKSNPVLRTVLSKMISS
jgi:hypothetical protein